MNPLGTIVWSMQAPGPTVTHWDFWRIFGAFGGLLVLLSYAGLRPALYVITDGIGRGCMRLIETVTLTVEIVRDGAWWGRLGVFGVLLCAVGLVSKPWVTALGILCYFAGFLVWRSIVEDCVEREGDRLVEHLLAGKPEWVNEDIWMIGWLATLLFYACGIALMLFFGHP